MKSFKVISAIKLSKFLGLNYGVEMPYSTYKKLLRNKDIKVNGVRVSSDVSLNIGDEVLVYFDGVKKPLSVVFEDENILVLDKPSGITSEDYEKQVQKEYKTAKLCHRLDRNTSGLIIFALNALAETELLKAFKTRTVEKYYMAEVYGAFDNNEGVLTDYLVKDSNNSLVKIYKTEVDNSVKIITEYKTIEKTKETSVLLIKLITGKTHQIRAHLAFYGKFIVGDGKYGDNIVNKRLKAKTQRLTAVKIVFDFKGGELKYLNGKVIELLRKPF